jgi:hypothetical protein
LDPAGGPRWRNHPLDKKRRRYGTPLVHAAARIDLGPKMAPVIRAYIVACTFTYDSTNLVMNGKMTLTRFAFQLGVSIETLRGYVDKLCCLDLVTKYMQRDVLPEDEDPEHPKAIALYVNNLLPPWVIKNHKSLAACRNATGRRERERAVRMLRLHQAEVVAEMTEELDRGIKNQPKAIGEAM